MALVETDPTSLKKKKYIGIDLHTNNFYAHYLTKQGEEFHERFFLNDEGFNEFFKTLTKKDEIAVESTGNTSFFYKRVETKVSKITVVATRQFKIISDSTKKTDRNDAKALAFYLSKDMLPKSRLKSSNCLLLGSLITTRANLIQIRTALINRTHSILNANGFKVEKSKLSKISGYIKYVIDRDWNETNKLEIGIIYSQIKNINDGIEQLTEKIDILASKMYGYENLKSILGIGSLSAAILLYVIDDISDFESHKKLASYFGIVPSVRESNGIRKSTQITKRGSSIGRSTLVRCTYVSKRYNPYLKNFYDRIKERGGSKKAVIACSNKLLKIIFNTLKNDWVFEDFANFKYYHRDKNN